ncbi:hypothetical protein F4780DRAFT_779338 [Xylariomycetidae sp. FL0641]|nr:hypothetical protein F4780DRAFT_779338 [Xylariomycetidae sp. FL0641]
MDIDADVHIPKPRNRFIVFRCRMSARLHEANPEMTLSEISKRISPLYQSVKDTDDPLFQECVAIADAESAEFRRKVAARDAARKRRATARAAELSQAASVPSTPTNQVLQNGHSFGSGSSSNIPSAPPIPYGYYGQPQAHGQSAYSENYMLGPVWSSAQTNYIQPGPAVAYGTMQNWMASAQNQQPAQSVYIPGGATFQHCATPLQYGSPVQNPSRHHDAVNSSHADHSSRLVPVSAATNAASVGYNQSEGVGGPSGIQYGQGNDGSIYYTGHMTAGVAGQQYQPEEPMAEYANQFEESGDGVNWQEIDEMVDYEAGTGSGKTTQIPALAYHVLTEEGSKKKAAYTQPRRVPVLGVAIYGPSRRTSLGEEVGHLVRFERAFSKNKAKIVYMTDGMLVRECQSDAMSSNTGIETDPHIPKPRNAFIVYRCRMNKILHDRHPDWDRSRLSKEISPLYRQAKNTNDSFYQECLTIAREEKLEYERKKDARVAARRTRSEEQGRASQAALLTRATPSPQPVLYGGVLQDAVPAGVYSPAGIMAPYAGHATTNISHHNRQQLMLHYHQRPSPAHSMLPGYYYPLQFDNTASNGSPIPSGRPQPLMMPPQSYAAPARHPASAGHSTSPSQIPGYSGLPFESLSAYPQTSSHPKRKTLADSHHGSVENEGPSKKLKVADGSYTSEFATESSTQLNSGASDGVNWAEIDSLVDYDAYVAAAGGEANPPWAAAQEQARVVEEQARLKQPARHTQGYQLYQLHLQPQPILHGAYGTHETPQNTLVELYGPSMTMMPIAGPVDVFNLHSGAAEIAQHQQNLAGYLHQLQPSVLPQSEYQLQQANVVQHGGAQRPQSDYPPLD